MEKITLIFEREAGHCGELFGAFSDRQKAEKLVVFLEKKYKSIFYIREVPLNIILH